MKRPSFQFYPADWKGNAKLRRCSEAPRGAWMDVLCVLHDEDEYGVARYPLAELARAAGVPLKHAKELADKGVLKGADRGPVVYIYVKSHAGKEEPITLLETTGPCWFSSRMVRDEWLRSVRGGTSRFTAENQPTREPNGSPDRRVGEPSGDGATSASATSTAEEEEQSSLRSDSAPQASPVLDTRKTKRRAVPKTEPPGFAEFYEAYPKKKKRPDAAKSYRAVVEQGRATPEQLLAGARRYAIERRDEDPQYTPHPTTWLNNDCWLDEGIPNGSNGSKHGRNGSGDSPADRAIRALATTAGIDLGRHDEPHHGQQPAGDGCGRLALMAPKGAG